MDLRLSVGKLLPLQVCAGKSQGATSPSWLGMLPKSAPRCSWRAVGLPDTGLGWVLLGQALCSSPTSIPLLCEAWSSQKGTDSCASLHKCKEKQQKNVEKEHRFPSPGRMKNSPMCKLLKAKRIHSLLISECGHR